MNYDTGFYERTELLAARAAEVVVPLLHRALPIRSVADFGCARGTWLTAWAASGATVIHGVDGPWVRDPRIAPSDFTTADLAAPVSLGRRFDLVQCLEVAEHLPAAAAGTLVDSLCRHASIVLFSGAPPGQGGEHHVNERPYAYWRDLFAGRGYRLYDFVRPRLRGAPIAPWYRYNTFLFAEGALPPEVAATLIVSGPIADVAPLSYRVRRRLVRTLSPDMQTAAMRWARRLGVVGR